MRLTLYQIDAFARQPFAGNPAAVIPLERWPDDALMQNIAAENNLSETAFLIGANGRYRLRWFAPLAEVDFCGHATLAAAWVVFNELESGLSEVQFETRAGELTVRRTGDGLLMDFPVRLHLPCKPPPGLAEALGVEPREVLRGDDWIAVLADEAQVLAVDPDPGLLKTLPGRAVVVTAAGDEADFVSRVFGPKVGIDEDPVTGSTHCALTPFWGERLGKRRLHARQLSPRGGELVCEWDGKRVHITGHCAKYMTGAIELDD